MFESLKSKTNRENMELIKKQSDFKEDGVDFSKMKSLFVPQVRQLQKPKERKDGDKLLARRLHLSVGKIETIFQHNQHEQSSMSFDSLSDYELEERGEIFTFLNNNDFPLVYKTNEDKEIAMEANSCYSPQRSIKQLQHLVELSEQKLRLTKDSHNKDIESINYQHQLAVEELSIKIQQLQLLVRNEDNKRARMQEMQKQNKQLKESLQSYEEKYWRYQTLQIQLRKVQTQNKMLSIKQAQLMNQLQLMDSVQTIKSNTSPNNLHKSISNINPHKENHQNNHQNHKKTIQNQEIQQLLKKISKLQNKLIQLEQQLINDKSYHQKQIVSYQKRISDLQSQLNQKNKIIHQSQCRIEQLREENQKVEKSLLQTMDSFSKHLQRQSAHISELKLNKSSPLKDHIKQTQVSLKQNQIYKEETINLDLNQSLKPPKTTHRQLQSISPVHINHSLINKHQQYLTRNEYIPNTAKHYHQRTRIMSHQQQANKLKHTLCDTLYNDPEKQLTSESKIAKLEKKLQIANKKIIQLLKQKVQRAATFTFR